MREVVVVSAARIPFGKFGGYLRDYSAVDLGTRAVQAVIEKIHLAPETVEELIMGVAVLAGTAAVAARQILFTSGLPANVPSLTLDRACCSSMTAAGLAVREIATGEVETVVAGGMEAMSQAPLVARGVRWGTRLGGIMLEEPLMMRNPIVDTPIAVGTGDVSLQYGIDREQQDQWALDSHRKYFAALAAGKFKDEIYPWHRTDKDGNSTEVMHDEPPRADASLEKLRQLKPVYGGKTVTAGNAPGLNDGASALILMSRERQKELGYKRLATILSYVNTAGDPLSSPYMPALSIRKALEKAGLTLKDLKRIEINEAFAAMPLVSAKILADGNSEKMKVLLEKTNVNGGAIAIGHPVGASGARILMTLIYELRRRGGGIGVASICGGLAQGDGVVVQVGGDSAE